MALGRRAGRREVAAGLGDAPTRTGPHGWLVLESGSVSYGKATSYLPVDRPAQELLSDRAARRRAGRSARRSTGKLLTLDRTLEPILPPLLALLDVPVEDAAAGQALDPAQRRRRRRSTPSTRLLLRESQEQPLLLVFEDLHWIDSETQALLDSLVESLPTARILLLVNYRPGVHPRLGQQELLHPAPDRPAGAGERRGAARGAARGAMPPLEPLKALLIERTEGNPFFLEESVRALVETGALVGERGAYRLTAAGRDDPGAGDGPGGAGGPHRPAAARGEAAAPDGRRDRQGRARYALLRGDRRARPTTSCTRRSRAPPGGRAAVRRRACSRSWSTRSSTR